MKTAIKAVTHDGKFHADELLAWVIIRLALPTAELTRTRDRDVIAEADICFDVGDTFNPESGRFDHHQWKALKGEGRFRENGIPFAAAGLVWETYGVAAVRQYVKKTHGTHITTAEAEEIVKAVDVSLMQGVDVIDTGYIKTFKYVDGNRPPNINSFSQRMSRQNVSWRADGTARDETFAFFKACRRAEEDLADVIEGCLDFQEAKVPVASAFAKRVVGVMILEVGCPWQSHLINMDPDEEVLFVISQSGEDEWMISNVPSAPGSFQSRGDLPEKWAGLRDEDLQKVSGVEDAIFVHGGRFCGAARSIEGAMAMAFAAVGFLRGEQNRRDGVNSSWEPGMDQLGIHPGPMCTWPENSAGRQMWDAHQSK
jgi:uncharacterized UPF0160 family protein